MTGDTSVDPVYSPTWSLLQGRLAETPSAGEIWHLPVGVSVKRPYGGLSYV